jgi:hypothetical protein
MTKQQKENVEQAIKDLCACDEALAALDQLAGQHRDLPPVASVCYTKLMDSRRRFLTNWNSDDEEVKIIRCSGADPEYHADSKKACDVWIDAESTYANAGLCECCGERAAEQAATR